MTRAVVFDLDGTLTARHLVSQPASPCAAAHGPVAAAGGGAAQVLGPPLVDPLCNMPA